MSPTASQETERELKFAASLELLLPDLRGLVGGTFRLPEQDLLAAYFDTGDFRLWSRGITLRHRTGEGPGEGVWTLKLPEPGDDEAVVRSELSWPGQRDVVPSEARRVLRGVVGHAEIAQVAELRTLRHPLELRDVHGRTWAVLDDDVVTVSGGRRDGLRFRQVEIELAGSADADRQQAGARLLGGVVEALRRTGARPERTPKLATALGLPTGRDDPSADLDGRSTLDAVVRASIASGLDQLLDHDVRLRIDPAEPPAHAVHQARVATRRLRSDLKTFREALDPVWVDHTRDDLRWIGTALGAVRDLDVLAAQIETPATAAPIDAAGQRELLGHLAEQRRLAARHLSYLLDGDERYLMVLDRLRAAVERPPFRSGQGPRRQRHALVADASARIVLPQLVGAAWRSLRKQVRRVGSDPSSSDLHRIRIKSKQLRYAAEVAAPVMGAPARRTAERAKALQTVLGDHHDAVAAEEWLWNEALGASPWGSFSAGQLTAQERHRQRVLGRRWRKDWDRLRRNKVRRWMG